MTRPDTDDAADADRRQLLAREDAAEPRLRGRWPGLMRPSGSSGSNDSRECTPRRHDGGHHER
jgi:hypothetical protein